MADVFISYARENRAAARLLAEAVAREGLVVWWDEDLPPHRAYGEVITEQIGAARAAIVIWSGEAAASEWVRAEADVARVQRKLIQTSVDATEPPLPFNQLQYVSIADWRGALDHPGWLKVKASLAALCGPARAPGPTPGFASAPAAPRAPAASGASRTIWLGAMLLALIVLVAIAIGLLSVPTREPAERPARVARAPEAKQDDPPIRSAGLPRIALPGRQPEAPAPPAMPGGPSDEYEDRMASPDPNEPTQILPQSSARRLRPDDLAGLSRGELRIARNEIYARRGRIFRDPALTRHFRRFRWYRPERGEVALGPVEQANIALLQGAESHR